MSCVGRICGTGLAWPTVLGTAAGAATGGGATAGSGDSTTMDCAGAGATGLAAAAGGTGFGIDGSGVTSCGIGTDRLATWGIEAGGRSVPRIGGIGGRGEPVCGP